MAAWLAGQEGVDVSVDEYGIVFRVQGDRPTWLLTPPDEAPAGDVIESHGVYPQNVVGHGTPRERDDRRKKALVLSPFAFQLGTADPGAGIQNILGSHRDYGYAGGVTPLANGEVTVSAFMGWQDYDVIAVTTHGKEVGEDGWGCALIDLPTDLWDEHVGPTCLVGIYTGERVEDCDAERRARYPNVPGIDCGRVRGAEGQFFVLDTDFFIWEYAYRDGEPRDRLDKGIVYMGGCHTFDNSNLAVTLAGGSSEYFGWDDPVHRLDNYRISLRLFTYLVADGLTTVEAYEELEDEDTSGTFYGVLGELEHESNGDGLHIREITTLKNPLHPSVAGSQQHPSDPLSAALLAGGLADDEEGTLRSGDVLPFLGQAGDGQEDEAFFYVDVDGVRPGRESVFDVTVAVDGVELGTWSLEGDRARRIDDNTVRLRVRQSLGFDVQDGSTLQLRATTNLPGDGDGESRDEVSVVLANPVLHVHSTIETEEDEFTSLSEVRGDVPLSFHPGDDPDDLEVGPSRGLLEYVRYEITMPAPDGCSIETATVDGHMEIREGDVRFDSGAAGFGVPEELRIFPAPELKERVSIVCPQGQTGFETIHWFAGFVGFHGGGWGGPNELDEQGSSFVIGNWVAGTGEVYATRTYARSGTEDGVTLSERTTLELRGPRYREGASGDPD